MRPQVDASTTLSQSAIYKKEQQGSVIGFLGNNGGTISPLVSNLTLHGGLVYLGECWPLAHQHTLV